MSYIGVAKTAIARKMKEAETKEAKEALREVLIEILSEQERIVYETMKKYPDLIFNYQIAKNCDLTLDQVRRMTIRLVKMNLIEVTDRRLQYSIKDLQ